MVAGDHLACRAGLALVEQDEVLDDVQQSVVRQHAVQQYLGLYAALIRLVESLPLGEVPPLTGDGAIAGAVAVRDDQEAIVMEGMRDDVLVHVVGQVVVEPLADVLVHRLQFDEDQRQPVHEADQISAAVVVRSTDTGQLQLAHGEEPVGAGFVVEVDDPGARSLAAALGIPVFDRHAAAQEPVEVAVVLYHRTADVMNCQIAQRIAYGRGRQFGVEPFQRRAEVAGQHGFLRVGTAKGAVRAEGFLVPGIDAFPAKFVFEMLGEGRLNQPVFAVDSAYCHRCLALHHLERQVDFIVF